MLQDTVARLQPLIMPQQLFIAVNAVHAPEVVRQIPELPADQIVVEPVARETGPAFGLAAIHIAHRDPDAIIASFHADHVVLRPDFLRDAVTLAADAVHDGAIVTIGIEPTYAATGYGYIELADEIGAGYGHIVRKALRFVEKPGQDVAEQYLATGNFVWNAGLFICKVQTLLNAFREHLPQTWAGLMHISEAIGTDRYVETLEAVFPALQKISIDVGIMEKFHRLRTVPCDPGWNDVGDWDTLASLMEGDDNGNVAIGAQHLAIETKRTLVHGRDRLIATVGVEDLVIVDTEDAVLVLPRNRAQDVKKIVEQLTSHR
jgi:mannose-1-phosphate guanylyltransferase